MPSRLAALGTLVWFVDCFLMSSKVVGWPVSLLASSSLRSLSIHVCLSVCVCESRRWNCQFANVHVCLIFDFYLTLNDTSISILFNAIKRISRKVLVEM